MSKTISLQDETYKRLAVVLGKLQISRKKPQSFDSTINYMFDRIKVENEK